MGKRDYYDRVRRGGYGQSGFEAEVFRRTDAASLANLNFSNLKELVRYRFQSDSNRRMDCPFRSSKPLMHTSRHREFPFSVGEHEQRLVFL
jgi:hypothetical protein